MAGHGDKKLGETIAGIESRSRHALDKTRENSEYIHAVKLFFLKKIEILEKEIEEQRALIKNHIERSNPSK